MLLAPGHWYAAVRGGDGIRPLNIDFVRDIGITYLTLGVAFLLAEHRPWAGRYRGNHRRSLADRARAVRPFRNWRRLPEFYFWQPSGMGGYQFRGSLARGCRQGESQSSPLTLVYN